MIIGKIIIISLFCLGLRAITDEGMIFYFLRKPFEGLYDKAQNFKELFGSSSYQYRLAITKAYIAKPIILCHTCFASVWGTAVYLSMWEFDLVSWAIACVSAAYLNAFGWKLLNTLR